MFSIGQRTAVEVTVGLANLYGPSMTNAAADLTERLVHAVCADDTSIVHWEAPEHKVGPILGCKAWLIERPTSIGALAPLE